MDPTTLRKPFDESEPTLSQEHARVLAAPIEFLERDSQHLVDHWTDMYLSTLGRRSFFSADRVRKIFGEMLSVFLRSLRQHDFRTYFETLKEKGRFFSRLGVPFEEVILSLQLFQKAYLALILKKEGDRRRLDEILPAFEEFNHLSTTVFAVSYFNQVQGEWQDTCEAYREESDKARQELRELHGELYQSTSRRLDAMNVVMNTINKKLRKSVFQARQIQRLSELLLHESQTQSLLLLADKHLKKLLPEGAEVAYGLMDEHLEKVALYRHSELPKDTREPVEVFQEIFRSQLPQGFQDALFGEETAAMVLDGQAQPDFFQSEFRWKPMKECLFLAMKKYRHPVGFLFIGCPEPGVFAKPSVRLYQRLATVIANAVFGAASFNRYQRQNRFVSFLDQLDLRLQHAQSLEGTLDFCLESLIELLGVERASLMLLDQKSKTLTTYAAKGYRVYPFSGLQLKWGEGIAGWSLKESKIVSISRLKERAQAGLFKRRGLFESRPNLNIKSLACLPLKDREDPIGVVNLSTISFHKKFEPSEIDMASTFAEKISQALTRLSETAEGHHPRIDQN